MKSALERILFVGAMLFSTVEGSMAQSVITVVVADADTHQGVPHASLYAKEDGRFHSAMTNEQGVAHINFAWNRLTVSHLNYQQRIVPNLKSQISNLKSERDTIFLTPRYRNVGQVVVTPREPEWIRRCLKKAVRQKETVYWGHEGCDRFDYHTQSIGTNSIYRMQLTGWLRHKSQAHKHYAMVADTAALVAADTTRLTDTSNLRRMLYEDFMADLDNAFIRHHRFYANYEYRGSGPDEIELRFRSPKNVDDHGVLVIDTARCVILSAYRHTGTKTNRQERIDGLMYRMAQVFGYRIDTFIRDYRVAYAQRPDGTLYPAQVSYKLVYGGRDGDSDSRQEEFHEQTGGGFPNMEATLTITPTDAVPAVADSAWTTLPPSWYIKFNSDADRREEIQLSSLPAVFSIYEEE